MIHVINFIVAVSQPRIYSPPRIIIISVSTTTQIFSSACDFWLCLYLDSSPKRLFSKNMVLGLFILFTFYLLYIPNTVPPPSFLPSPTLTNPSPHRPLTFFLENRSTTWVPPTLGHLVTAELRASSPTEA